MQALADHLTLRGALDRTLLLMRDHVSPEATDKKLLDALTGTVVCLVADEANIRSHSAQTAFVTTALLLARSGHEIYLSAPDTKLVGQQPPLGCGALIEQLQIAGRQILPGREFKLGRPREADLAILLGNTPWHGRAATVMRMRATAWSGRVSQFVERVWPDEGWPIGGLVAAGLAAPEAFKISMRRLQAFAQERQFFDEFYRPTVAVTLNVAPTAPAKIHELRSIDFVSGGAISNAALYALLRVPNAVGRARIIEDDVSAISNLNRCMLFLRNDLGAPKAVSLAAYSTQEFKIAPEIQRFDSQTTARIGPLADAVLVGVDHIPSRWTVQKTWPKWLGVGATSHFSAMASFHAPGLPCAGCAHPVDDPIPGDVATVAFVSFWAGLWTAALYLRFLGNDRGLNTDQQYFFTPSRPEELFHSRVARRGNCPVHCTIAA